MIYSLVAENPASLRISGDQGSSTACHPVRSSRKALTRQPPFTPSTVPCPLPKPVPMIVIMSSGAFYTLCIMLFDMMLQSLIPAREGGRRKFLKQ